MDGVPRVAPLPEESWGDRERAVLEPLLRTPTRNIYTTLVRAPELAERMTAFGRALRGESLPVRHRETLILRTGWNCQAEYEFAQHRRLAQRAGMTERDIERIKEGPSAADWDAAERGLCTLADELHQTNRIADATWDALAARYDEQQLIQAVLLVGYYHLVGFFANGVGVPLEEGAVGFEG
jgi:4-carboxymuconolactone decarboxylase